MRQRGRHSRFFHIGVVGYEFLKLGLLLLVRLLAVTLVQLVRLVIHPRESNNETKKSRMARAVLLTSQFVFLCGLSQLPLEQHL